MSGVVRRRVRVIGIGPGGPDQLTVEAVEALRSVDAHLVVRKAEHDPLVAARQAILARHVPDPVPTIEVEDPPRDRSRRVSDDDAAYRQAVANWHRARAERYAEAIAGVDGTVGILVWGDPAFYDSTLRILGAIDGIVVDVVPGVSSLQLLAARHRIVLHGIGEPLHLTTGRRLGEAVAGGQRNVAALLLANLDPFEGLDGWAIWWGANLGTPHEEHVAGVLPGALVEIRAARTRAKAAAGWVMDLALVRAAEAGR